MFLYPPPLTSARRKAGICSTMQNSILLTSCLAVTVAERSLFLACLRLADCSYRMWLCWYLYPGSALPAHPWVLTECWCWQDSGCRWLLCNWHHPSFLPVQGSSPADGEDPVSQHGSPAGCHEGTGQTFSRRHLCHRVHQHGRDYSAHTACGEWDQASIPVSFLYSRTLGEDLK